MKLQNIRKIRQHIEDKVEEYHDNGGKGHIKLDISSEILNQIMFYSDNYGAKQLAVSEDCFKALDLEGLSWDGVNVKGVDFSDTKGVHINPQTVWDKDLSNSILKDVNIIGDLKGVWIEGTDFTDSHGAVIYLEDTEQFLKLTKRGTNFRSAEVIIQYDEVLNSINNAFSNVMIKKKTKDKNN